MDTLTSSRPRMHPLVIAAAIAIIALSGAGIAAVLSARSEAQTSASPALAINAPAAPVANTVPPPPPGFDNTASVPAAPSGAGSAIAPPAPASAPALAEGPPAPASGPMLCAECATVEAMRSIHVHGQSTGLGAVGGGVAGGLIGHTIGNGHGNLAMTLLGAAGGALAGNAIEQNARTKTEYQLVVRYADGHERTFTHTAPWPYGVGSTVRIVNGRVSAAS